MNIRTCVLLVLLTLSSLSACSLAVSGVREDISQAWGKDNDYFADEGEHILLRYIAYYKVGCGIEIEITYENGTTHTIAHLSTEANDRDTHLYDLGAVEIPEGKNETSVNIRVFWDYGGYEPEPVLLVFVISRKPVYYRLIPTNDKCDISLECAENEKFRVKVILFWGPLGEDELVFASDDVGNGWNMTIDPKGASALYVYLWDRWNHSSSEGDHKDNTGLRYHMFSYEEPDNPWYDFIPAVIIGIVAIIAIVLLGLSARRWS